MLCTAANLPFEEFVQKHPKLLTQYNFAKDLNKVQGNLLANEFTKEKYMK